LSNCLSLHIVPTSVRALQVYTTNNQYLTIVELSLFVDQLVGSLLTITYLADNNTHASLV